MSQFLMSAPPSKDEMRYAFSRAEVSKELRVVIAGFYDAVSDVIFFLFIVLIFYHLI